MNPLDRYAVFDFMVTADHMVDWIHNGDSAAQKAERDRSPLLKICYQISSGAKHFEATHRVHRSVQRTELYEGSFTSEFNNAFDGDALGIVLTDEAANKLGFNWMDALTLAEMLFRFWERHPALQDDATST